MCHLCLEKGLKACIVEYMDVFPPRTHNLGRLAEAARLELPPGFAEFIFRLSDESVRTRYPEEYRVRYTKATAQRYLQKTEEAFLWLRQKLTSRP
jgi:HEPN domain-containing protein